MQTKLLRVLQEHEVMRIGDNRVIPVDVRVIAATNKDLYKEMQKGNYRQDLYYRLNVLNLGLPPLRKREGDIKILMEKLRDKMNKKLNCRIEGFSPGVIELMENYNWPGNIRELENIIEKLSVLTASGIVGDEMIPFIEDCMHYDEAKEIGKAEQTLCMMEIEAIKAALQQNNGNRTHAAQQLGIDRTTLIRKIKAYDL